MISSKLMLWCRNAYNRITSA